MIESKRLGDILKLVNSILLVVFVILLVQRQNIRIDLTEENRYSIGDATKKMLNELEDQVFVEVYLDGDLPAGFIRLQNSIRETLEEFKIYSGNKVQYSFTNPGQALSSQSRDEYMRNLASKGLMPTDVFDTENGTQIQKRIIPGALVTYGRREKGVLLLKGNKGASSEVQLNQSAEGVEFELASAINSLTKSRPEVVGFSMGHGELSNVETISLTTALQEEYIIKSVDLRDNSELSNTDLLIIAKPMSLFEEIELLNLDQHILNGKPAIFLLDAVHASLDSLTMAASIDVGLDNMLFRYGVRVNKDLIQDRFALSEPIVVGNFGENPQIELLQWPFYPLINSFSDHPTMRSLDALTAKYISSVDTVKSQGVKKTILFSSSPYSRTLNAPFQIDINELKKPIRPESFTQSNIPMAVLLDGNFTSVFRNRPLPDGAGNDLLENGSSAIVVIGDGDFIKNDLDPKNGSPLPLGFDPYTSQTFANEQVMLNLIQYLLNEDGLIQARNKQIMLRPLDKVRIQNERSKWQLINLVIPIVILILYGFASHLYRKKKYASN